MPRPRTIAKATPLRWQPTPDGRSRGTFTQFLRDHLAARPDGASVEAILTAARKAGKIIRLPESPKQVRAVIRRLINMGELEAADGGMLRLRRSRMAARRNRGR